MTIDIDSSNSASLDSASGSENTGASFDRDVLPLAGDLYRCAYTYTKNAADAEDLVQETMRKAFKAFDRLRDDTHFKAWLLPIMRNTWISKYRTDIRRPAENLIGDIYDGQLDSATREVPDEALSAEYQALRNTLNPDVIAALLALSDDMRETLYYVAIEGLKCREAAEVMGVSERTVLSRMHRIRSNRRRSLGEFARQRGLLDDLDDGHAA
jgi:RNA polymerase sigma-70 factor (ECF subfamily)